MLQTAKDNVNQVNSANENTLVEKNTDSNTTCKTSSLGTKETVDRESNNSKSDIEIKQEDKNSVSYQNSFATNSMDSNEKQESDSRSISPTEPEQKK